MPSVIVAPAGTRSDVIATVTISRRSCSSTITKTNTANAAIKPNSVVGVIRSPSHGRTRAPR